MKCWCVGAYVCSATWVPYGGCCPTGNFAVTMIPVARTSHSMFPSW